MEEFLPLVDGLKVQTQNLVNCARCYLCDRIFEHGDEPLQIFKEHLQPDGKMECLLPAFLSSALDREVLENTAHSKYLCVQCNFTVLEYGSLEQRFYQLRFQILTEYNKTAKRNGLPLIPIEIDGVLQEEDFASEVDQEVEATASVEQQQQEQLFMLPPKQENLVEQLPAEEELIVIGMDDTIVLESLVEESPDISGDNVFELESFQPVEIKKEEVLTSSDLEANALNNDEIAGVKMDPDDIIYNELIEQCSQMSDEDGSSLETQYFEAVGSNNCNSNTPNFTCNSEGSHEDVPCNTKNIENQPILCPEGDTSQPETKPIRTRRHLKDALPSMYEQEGSAYRCLLCPTTTDTEFSPKSFSTHMNTHGYRFYACDLCDIGFPRRQDFNDHMAKKEHGHFECETCHRIFTNYRFFRIHKRMHSANPNFECDVCHKRYISKNLLDGHMNMHTGHRPYKCTQCPKDFASKYTLQAHLKIHGDRQRRFPCDQCDKAFLNQQNLNQHRRLHSGVKSFVCARCNKAFGTQHNLIVHQIVHSGNKPFICRTCGKAFARRAEIKDHERTHTGERPFKCDLCDMAFAQRSNLSSHKKSTHFNEKQHTCQHCGRKFKRRRLLDYHIQSAHTGERPHKCEICGASFVYPEHHKKHMLIHMGIKPYACEVCGKQFNSRDNRNAHRFIHSNKKPYECLECGAGFMRKPLLLAHMKQTKHSNDTIIINQPQIEVSNAIEGLVVNEAEDSSQTQEEMEAVLDLKIEDSYDQISQSGENILIVVDSNEGSSDAIANADKQLMKYVGDDVRYLQFEELDDEGHETLTWVDIGDKDS